MQFTLFSADCIGKAANCSYPHKVLVDDAMTMEGAVAHDHVCATYKNNYRNIIYGNPKDILNEIKFKVKPLTYNKIENLYILFKDKIDMFTKNIREG